MRRDPLANPRYVPFQQPNEAAAANFADTVIVRQAAE